MCRHIECPDYQGLGPSVVWITIGQYLKLLILDHCVCAHDSGKHYEFSVISSKDCQYYTIIDSQAQELILSQNKW